MLPSHTLATPAMPEDIQHQVVQVGSAIICVSSLCQRDLAIFSGTDQHDVEEQLTSYKRASLYNKWYDETKFNNVIFYLTGISNLWHRNHEVDTQTWLTFKTNFS